MGHSRASKQQTHEQIVSVAARCFRESGFDGVSIADLMQQAGLTHGGFYKHFSSRDELVAEALSFALNSSSQRYRAMQDMEFSTFVSNYLGTRHRDMPGDGCAMAALVGDMTRVRDDARTLYTDQLRRTIDRVTGLMGGEDEGASAADAIVVFSALVGALGIARALNDEVLSQQVLSSVRDYLLGHFPAKPREVTQQ